MPRTPMSPAEPAPRPPLPGAGSDAAFFSLHGNQPCCANDPFIGLLNSYRPIGGLAQGQEVVAMFRNRGTGDLANLASWILNRQVISFDWQSKIWLPLFQFNRADMAPLPGLRDVLAELTPAYQAWELAQWFIQPHPWLDLQTPAHALAKDQGAVLNAACFDRLIATNKR